MNRLLVLIVLCTLPFGVVRAEPYPLPQSLAVNDYAEVITAEAESRLVGVLEALRAETGIEATVLTIPTRNAYDPAASLEAFTTGLFNAWGIGNADRHDGILVLVLPEDREMRIELGAGFDPEYDLVAQDIVNNAMLPAFREDRLSEGIEAGTLAVIDHIARRKAAAQGPLPFVAPATEAGRDWLGTLMMVVFGGGAAALVVRGPIGRVLTRLRHCPSCGRRGLRRTDRVISAATTTTAGEGEQVTRCRHCNWQDRRSYSISRKGRSSGGGSFGGGRSSGGGASGRW